MPITPTNQVKHAISPSNATKMGFYLLLESGDYILQEDNYKIFMESISFGVSMVNQTKHSITPVNQVKN